MLFDASPIFWFAFSKLVIAIANLFGRKSDKTFDMFCFGVFILLSFSVLSIEYRGNKFI